MRKLLIGLIFLSAAWASDIRSDEVRGAHFLTIAGTVPRVDALGVINQTMLTCTAGNPGTCLLYDTTGGTGLSLLAVRAGAGQGAADLMQWRDIAGTNFIEINPSTGRLYVDPAFPVGGVSFIFSSGMADTSGRFSVMEGVGDSTATAYNSFTLGTSYSTTAVRIGSPQGIVSIDSKAAGKWAGLRAGTVALQSLATPAAPVVTPTCVPGVCNLTWSYNVAAVQGDGTSTDVGAVGSTALQNGTIDANSYNTLTVAPVAGATFYRWYRTVSAGIPATLGLIGTTTAPTLVDNGLAGDTFLGPDQNKTGQASILSAVWNAGLEGTCDATNRGRAVMTQPGGAAADTFRICTRDAGGVYGWRALY